jgi:hypothetical protein
VEVCGDIFCTSTRYFDFGFVARSQRVYMSPKFPTLFQCTGAYILQVRRGRGFSSLIFWIEKLTVKAYGFCGDPLLLAL